MIFSFLVSNLIAGQIPYPSKSTLYKQVKNDKTVEMLINYYGFDQLSLSDLKITDSKGEKGKLWEEYASKDLRNSNVYKVWPNDRLHGFVILETPANKYGEKFQIHYKVIFSRSSKIGGKINLHDEWRYYTKVATNTITSNPTLTEEIMQNAFFDFLDINEKKFADVIRIDRIEWNKTEPIGITLEDESLHYQNELFELSGNRVVAFLDIDFVEQKIYGSEIKSTEKFTKQLEVEFQREGGEWKMFYIRSVKVKRGTEKDIETSEMYGKLHEYKAREIFKQYQPYKAKPNTEMGKMAFAKKVDDLFSTFKFRNETKESEIAKIQELTLNNDLAAAESIWNEWHDISMSELSLTEKKVEHGDKVRPDEEGADNIAVNFDVRYKANRNLDKAKIKELKKTSDKTYLDEWMKVVEDKKFLATYYLKYTNNKWHLLSVNCRILRF